MGFSILRRVRSASAALGGCGLMIGFAAAQTNPSLVNPDGVPAQIVPTYGEVGITWGGLSGGSNVTGGGGGGTSPSNTAVTNSGSYQPGSSTALDAMRATDYGSTAEAVAQQQGVSVAVRRGGRASRERLPQRAHQQRLQQRHGAMAVHDVDLPSGLQQIRPGLHGRGHHEPAGPGDGGQLPDARQCERHFSNAQDNQRRPCRPMAAGCSAPSPGVADCGRARTTPRSAN